LPSKKALGVTPMTDTDFFKMWSEFWKMGSTLAAAQPTMFKEMVGRMSSPSSPPPPPTSPFGMPFSAGAAFPWQGMTFPWASFAPADQATKGASDSFQTAMEAWKELPSKLGFAADRRADAASDTVTAELLKKILDPREWMSVTGFMDATVQRLTEGPKFADFGHVEQMYAALAKAWGQLCMVNAEHQSNVLKAWTKAIGEFVSTLNKTAAKGTPLTSRSEIVAIWVEIGNRHLIEAQSSEPYLKTQRELLRASLDFRLAQQAITNFYAELFGVPTRPEIDDLARMVADLRREVRTYRRARQQDARTQE
jgi:polyhydroxyalkanoate synthase subunit PhaE